jgi:cytochrome c-type biogenesis protein CcmH
MINFVLMGVATLAVVLVLLFRPFYLKRRAGAIDRKALNASIYRDELERLNEDLKSQRINAQDHEIAVAELQSRLLSDVDIEEVGLQAASPKKLMISLGLGVSILATLLYIGFGGMADVMQTRQPAVDPEVEKMVAGLAQKLEKDPTNYKGWAMLARSYKVMRRPIEAERAYEKAMPSIQNDPQILAEYADVAAGNANGSFDGKPDQLIQRALRLDPNHVMSLWLAGTSSFNKEDYRGAIQYWERIARLIPVDSDDGRAILGSINEARAKLGLPPVVGIQGAPKKEVLDKAAAHARISGVVNLDPSVQSKVDAKDTLMVIVRGGGGRMPVAVLRIPAKFPYEFSVDDSNSMTPDFRLSSLKEVSIEARVSKHGQAKLESGDLLGESVVAKIGESGISLLINRVNP